MAENDVDKLVLDTFFRNVRNGVLCEVGAAGPDFLSISARFRAAGWKIVAIEPNPFFCAQHVSRGYSVLEYACGDQDKDDVEFFMVDSRAVDYRGEGGTYESFSSLGIRDEFNELYGTIKDKCTIKKIPVKMRKLDTILATHEPDLIAIDVVVVDVEGWELSVLNGFTLTRFRPKVVILENIFGNTAYGAFMQKNGYVIWLRIGLNEIYIRSEMQSALFLAAAIRAGMKHRITILKQRISCRIDRALGRDGAAKKAKREAGAAIST